MTVVVLGSRFSEAEMSDISNNVDDVIMPSPSGERKGIPRNIHWILIGILAVGLAIVVLRSAIEKEKRDAEVKEAREKSELKGKTGIERKTDPFATA